MNFWFMSKLCYCLKQFCKKNCYFSFHKLFEDETTNERIKMCVRDGLLDTNKKSLKDKKQKTSINMSWLELVSQNTKF